MAAETQKPWENNLTLSAWLSHRIQTWINKSPEGILLGYCNDIPVLNNGARTIDFNLSNFSPSYYSEILIKSLNELYVATSGKYLLLNHQPRKKYNEESWSIRYFNPEPQFDPKISIRRNIFVLNVNSLFAKGNQVNFQRSKFSHTDDGEILELEDREANIKDFEYFLDLLSKPKN